MSEPIPLQYHTWTFRLLGREPRVSADAVRTIEQWEAQPGIKLPASVREWYSLEGIEEVLAAVWPENRVIPLARFLAAFAGGTPKRKRKGPPFVLLFGKRPASGGCSIYLDRDGTDDPQVSGVEVPFS